MSLAQPAPAELGRPIDVPSVASELHARALDSPSRHAARTVLREPDLRVVVIAMLEGSTIAEHHVDDTVAMQVLYGQLHVRLGERLVELGAGQLLPLAAGVAHDLVAASNTAFVLVLARRT